MYLVVRFFLLVTETSTIADEVIIQTYSIRLTSLTLVDYNILKIRWS